jgi:hypothetical protein
VSASSSTVTKSDAEALYASNRPKSKDRLKGPSSNFRRPNKGEAQPKKSQDSDKEEVANGAHDRKQRQSGKRFPFNCHNCGRKGHMARDCRSKRSDQGNSAIVKEEEEWDVQALAAHCVDEIKERKDEIEGKEDSALAVATADRSGNRLKDWIVDSGCSNHLTGDKERLTNPVKYNGSRVVVIADDSRHSIAHIGDVILQSEDQRRGLKLSDVYHVPGMKKNLLSVPQLTAEGKYVLFGPNDVRVYKEFETTSVPILKGHKDETIYVLSAEHAFVEKTKDTQNADLWHYRLGHVGYDKLKLMMEKGLVTGLPKLEVNREIVCAGCQYGKAHQEPFHSSSYRAEAPLVLVHSDVWGPARHASMKGLRYVVTFIDDFSLYLDLFHE